MSNINLSLAQILDWGLRILDCLPTVNPKSKI